MSLRAKRGNLVANAWPPCIATRLPRRPDAFAHTAPRNDIFYNLLNQALLFIHLPQHIPDKDPCRG